MTDDLTAAFRKAAEIAKVVPKALQETAFNRALDALLAPSKGKHGAGAPDAPGSRKRAVRETKSGTSASSSEADNKGNHAAYLCEHMDRTSYAFILKAPRVLERSLALLRAAKDDFEIDGLGSTHIARVLTEKFRLRTTRQAVQQALDAAGDKADRVTPASGRAYYRIMHPGEVYLDSPEDQTTAVSRTGSKQRAPATIKRKAASRKKTPGTSKNRKAGTGPMVVVSKLVDTGYFATARTIRDIINHCGTNLGRHFKANEVSPPLLRLLRDKRLKRAKNSDKQYEYKDKQ